MSSVFKKELRTVKKQGKDLSLLDEIVTLLAEGETLPEKNHDHELSGNWKGHRECHIQPDWLLIYKITDRELILTLVRTGSHSSLFGK
ncbi:MAG: type II toxin-antitoxin system YafQ family toxin [Ruminiclostridium sp.]|nr:type II toxin-antitoxin system YafQ family toxin [Ruminiclostridium sp.]